MSATVQPLADAAARRAAEAATLKVPSAHAVAHRLDRLRDAVAAVLYAEVAGSTFTPEQRDMVRGCAVALAQVNP